ncbi:cbb3-type cytochrome oxidase assembly protein CcoS [Halomonas icarae]|uniref:Cbb3-type cytochrome oxidase assembly protein CcoS n=1 Tax=Halomonas icarae TaxID=2691040 RepID=A0A7X4W2X1_9GAMM|nr:cbb3-type cytochrome oxidase assembly protein CcoS [Halomonas icarae]MDR5900829.1 cbb3-type cytochrome oxidase assembly protein CcoS [Halomonas icarae]NAW13703.1 cbb3-type cytochrome oxidase assembly protein CcoS [Halomonas icarae]
MIILYLLIPLTLILLGLALWAFFWAVKNDQFEDLEGPAYRILFDEDENDRPPEERRGGGKDDDAPSSTSGPSDETR